MTGGGPFMKPCQGPQQHKSQQCEEKGRAGGGGTGRLVRLLLLLLLVINQVQSPSPPTSASDDMHIKHLSGCLMTPPGPRMSAHTGRDGCERESPHTARSLVQPRGPEPLFTSVMMKKSSPGSPCTTIFSPSSNWTGSSASATVRRSHLSRDPVEGE